MSRLAIRLFGKFNIFNKEEIRIEGNKAQELFAYLLIFRGQPHNREKLADVLWKGVTTEQAHGYFRKTLWQLKSGLTRITEGQDEIIQTDNSWIQVNISKSIWLDVEVFEQTYYLVRDIPGKDLAPDLVAKLKTAIEVYRGDLLEGWYQDWCVCQRESNRDDLILLLDKLCEYCEVKREHEAGLDYAKRILSIDSTNEVAHQRVMRLFSLTGNRAAAMRQYQRCASVLENELGIIPSETTRELLKNIKNGRIID
jgi:two-component SAPR family response regulator